MASRVVSLRTFLIGMVVTAVAQATSALWTRADLACRHPLAVGFPGKRGAVEPSRS